MHAVYSCCCLIGTGDLPEEAHDEMRKCRGMALRKRRHQMAYASTRETFGQLFEEPEKYVGYGVHDPMGQKIGRLQKLFVNAEAEPEYVRVGLGLFGLKSVLIPVESALADEERKRLTLQ